ncbi:MAG: hypothetical protein N2595_02625 [bacterium]|nr:hypothetical protein [bacterium]
MRSRTFVAKSLAGVFLFVTSALARLICYDGFDYTAGGTLGGNNGGEGWSGAWSGSDPAYKIVAPGFTYDNGRPLYVTGNKVSLTNTGWGNSERMAAGAPYGAPGTTNWISCMIRLDSPTNENIYYHEVQLRDATSSRLALVCHDAFKPKWAVYQFGGPSAVAGVNIVPGEMAFLVARIIFGVNPTQDAVVMWVNPVLTNAPNPTDPLAAKVNVNHFTWDRIRVLSRLRQAYLDEIRVGETWDDVTPDEPTPVATPVNLSPTNGQTGVPLTPLLKASAFSSTKPSDVHEASAFFITSADGKSFSIVTGPFTEITLPSGLLQPNTRYSWAVQYKGTNSPKWSALSSATVFQTLYSGQSTLLAYDGCSYPPSVFPDHVGGKHGGTGWYAPWENAWTAGGLLLRVPADSPGLNYVFTGSGEYLLTTNNRFRTTEQAWNSGTGQETPVYASRVTRKLGTDGGAHLLAPSGRYGKIGTTNWFSFLARYESGDSSRRFGVSLNIDRRDDVPYVFFMGKVTGADTWGVMWSNNFVAASSKNALDGSTAFLVTRVVHGDPEATVHMWINPSTRVAPAEATADVITNVGKFEFNYLDVMAQGATEAPRTGIDEVRFGTDWEAVTPLGPAPPKFVGTPTNIAPADAALNVSLTPVIQASQFNGAGPNDLHLASEFEFVSLDSAVVLVSTSGLTSFTMPEGLLRHSTRYSWRCRYLGTNNNVWSEWSVPTTFTTLPGTPRLLAYDGAAYHPTNTINGANGGFGWRGPWQAQFWDTLPPGTWYLTQIAATNPGLEYTELVTTNNRFLTTPFGWTSGGWGPTEETPHARARRILKFDGNMHLVNNNLTFGKPGTTNWLSFLARAEAGSLGEYGVDLAITNSGNNEGLLAIGAVPDTGLLGAWVPGSSLQITSTNSAIAGTAFIVARLISGAAEDTLHLWVNPPLGAAPPATPSATLTAIPHVEFDRIGLRAGNTPTPYVALDELRFGETWESVTPIIPEPALALTVAGLLMAWRRP